MKTTISKLFFVIFSHLLTAQVAIGKTGLSSPDISVEFNYTFGDPETQRGIILPWIISESDVKTPVPGTLVFDSASKTAKVYVETDDIGVNIWKDLSVNNSGSVNTSEQTSAGVTELDVSKAIISLNTPITNTSGVLVLEDTDKAMVLPTVDIYSKVINPSAGCLVYDITNNLVCFFNGTVWSFWSPK